jgi:PAS domain S-box-containing protein
VEDFEAALSHKNGQAVPVSISARTFTDEHGRQLGIFVALRDITERQILNREHALLASIVTS